MNGSVIAKCNNVRFENSHSQIDEETKIVNSITEVDRKILKYQEQEKMDKQRRDNEDDDLDDFMSHLSKEKALDKTEIKKLRVSVAAAFIFNAFVLIAN